jgi:hypothetical protein
MWQQQQQQQQRQGSHQHPYDRPPPNGMGSPAWAARYVTNLPLCAGWLLSACLRVCVYARVAIPPPLCRSARVPLAVSLCAGCLSVCSSPAPVGVPYTVLEGVERNG